MKTKKVKYISLAICILATTTSLTAYAKGSIFKGEVQRFAITGEAEAVPLDEGETQSLSDPTEAQKETAHEVELSGKNTAESEEIQEEILPNREGFKGEVHRMEITGEQPAIPVDDATVPYALSETLTYSYGLYPEYGSVRGVTALAKSITKLNGSPYSIDSIYSRVSVVLKDGTKIEKKKTRNNEHIF